MHTTRFDIDLTPDETLIVSIRPGFLAYIDLGLKALLVFVAFAIYTRL